MSLSTDYAFSLYKTIFKDELYALIKAGEHGRFALNSREKRIIRNKNESMAEYAANYYIENFGTNLVDENIVQDAIDVTIKATLRHFR